RKTSEPPHKITATRILVLANLVCANLPMTTTPSRADTAYQALRQAIIEQALPPGTRLPEDVIGKEFAMSRTLARAILARLQAEGLIEAGRKRTATVARASLGEAQEDFEVRRAL